MDDGENDKFNKLFSAVSNGRVIQIQNILENDFEYQAFLNLSSTLLHQAANNSRSKVLDFIIQYGANVDGQNAQQNTALHVAARKGDFESIKVLLRNHAKVNAVDYDNRTPLYFAVYDGHYECAKLLLEDGNGIDVSITRKGDWTPLHEAARFGHLKCLKLLLEYQVEIMAKTEDAWWTPGHMAASNGRIDCLKVLLDGGIDINAGGGPNHSSTLLHEAAHNGHLTVVDLLLNSGSDPSLFDGHELPHHLASRYGHHEVLDILLTFFAKNKKFEHLIDVFTNVDPRANALSYHNAFHMASLYGRKECIKVLLKHNAKHLPNGIGQYPVMLTACKMHIECMKLLLDEAKRDRIKMESSKVLETGSGLSALHHLCAKTYKTTDKSIACACLLLNSNLIDINQCDERWDIPPCLFSSARNGAYGMVQYLLDSGADPFICPSLQSHLLNNPNVRKCSDLIIDAKEEPKTLLLACRLKIRKLLFKSSSVEKIYEIPIPKYLKSYIYHGHYHGIKECG